MDWLKKFMRGRYGIDQLSTALLVISIVLSILFRIYSSGLINILNLILLFAIFYRTLSKDRRKRYKENKKFLKIWDPISNGVNKRIQKIKNRKDYGYYKCSGCKQEIRVPKGKGKIKITCPKCKTTMIKKT